MWPAFVWTSTKNEWNAQNAVLSRAFRPSTPRNLIMHVLAIRNLCKALTALEQKRLTLDHCRPYSNVWLLPVLVSENISLFSASLLYM